MSPKDEALRQISQIKDHLIDKQHFYPYNYNAIYVWGVIATVMTLLLGPLYEAKGIFFGTVTATVLITLGFIIEGLLTKKVNMNYDIEDCTKRQRFVMNNFIFITVFLIVLSMILASYQLYIPIYLSWLFLISLGIFAMGYVLNIKRFSIMAQFNMTLTIVLLIVGWSQGHMVGMDSLCFRIVQGLLILGLAVLPSMIAWKLQREQPSV